MGGQVAKNLIYESPTNAYRYIRRMIRRFNVIPRAEKRIDKFLKEKPDRAPLPEVIEKCLRDELERNPDKLMEFSTKNTILNEYLKKVFVTSKGDNKDSFSVYQLRRSELMPKPDCPDPPGDRYTLKEAAAFLQAHKENPNEFSAEALGYLYNIDADKMRNILTHTRVFKVLLPKKAVRKPWYQRLKDDSSPALVITEKVEKEALLFFHQRSKNMRLFQHEKLGLPYDPGHPYLTGGKDEFPRLDWSRVARHPSGTAKDDLKKYSQRISSTMHSSPERDATVIKPEDDDFNIFTKIEDVEKKKEISNETCNEGEKKENVSKKL